MFVSRYPSTRLVRPRVLQSRSAPRGLLVLPKPFSYGQPEVVHPESCIVPSPAPGKVMVLEWSGLSGETHHHLVDL